MKPIPHPDFADPRLQNAPDAAFAPAPADGVLPENFFATTNLPTYVRLSGNWRMPRRPRMDGAIVLDSDGELWVKEGRRVRAGEMVVVGHAEDGSGGVFVNSAPFMAADDSEFRFMTSEVSREKPVDYSHLARILIEERDRGYPIWVTGPALVHSRARADMVWFIENGFVSAIFDNKQVRKIAQIGLATFPNQSAHAGQDQRSVVTATSSSPVTSAAASSRRVGSCASRSSFQGGSRCWLRQCSTIHHSAGKLAVTRVIAGNARISVESASNTPPSAGRPRSSAQAASPMYISQSWRSVAPPQLLPYMMKSLAPKTTITTHMVRKPKHQPMQPNVTRNSSGSSSPVSKNAVVLAVNALNMKCAMLIQTGVALPPKSNMYFR